jgi:MFS family permease
MDYSTQTSDLPSLQASPIQAQPAASRRRAVLSPPQIIAALKISVYEAFPAQIFVTLTGGVFMPAFALALGANNFYIGALAAIPFFANLFQLVGAYFVENYPGRKRLCVVASSLPRVLWAPAIILTLLLFQQEQVMIRGILLALLILVHAQLAISGVAWLSWMTDVVPENIRGRYFGLRNSLVSIATVLTTFAGGWFLDVQHGSQTAFGILFIIASIAGAACTVLLVKQPEPRKILAPPHKNFFRLYLEPFRLPNFRRLLRFSVIWQFAFYFASPFFVVYTLTEVGAGYTLVATYTVIGALFELLGMRVWGHISDRTGNKPVITIAAVVFTVLPWVWLLTFKNAFNYYFMIPLLHAAGGFFWAGYNLCSTNLMFRLAARERNSIYFGAWAACNGLAACAGSLLGGALGRWSALHHINLLLFSMAGLKIVFLLTGALRFAALWFLRPIKETPGMRTRQALELLRHTRNWRMMLKENAASPTKLEEEKFWPLFRRKKVARRLSMS